MTFWFDFHLNYYRNVCNHGFSSEHCWSYSSNNNFVSNRSTISFLDLHARADNFFSKTSSIYWLFSHLLDNILVMGSFGLLFSQHFFIWQNWYTAPLLAVVNFPLFFSIRIPNFYFLKVKYEKWNSISAIIKNLGVY